MFKNDGRDARPGCIDNTLDCCLRAMKGAGARLFLSPFSCFSPVSIPTPSPHDPQSLTLASIHTGTACKDLRTWKDASRYDGAPFFSWRADAHDIFSFQQGISKVGIVFSRA
jgi:hypothetical protein